MKICVVTAADATNLAIVNILKEFEGRGHIIDIYAGCTDSGSTRMFSGLRASIKPVGQLTKDIIMQYDVAFCGTDAMRHLIWFDIYVFCYNFIMNEWTTAGADFMFTVRKDRIVRHKEECATIPVGIAKNDTPTRDCTGKQILYIDAGHIPFGHRGKEQIAEMLLNICSTYPDYQLVVKPRWLLNDTESQTHRNSEHIYNVLQDKTNGELPENLVLLDKHLELQSLIDESDCVVTASISCYIDAALRGKGVVVVGGLDCEDQYELRKNVALKQDYDNAMDAGCVVDYRDVTRYLPYGIKVRGEHIDKILPCRIGTSKYVVDIVEYVFKEYLNKELYPQIKEYSFYGYKEEIKPDFTLTMQELKYKRMKNVILEKSRMFSYVDVKINTKEWYRELDDIYKSYSLDEKGLQELQIHMQKRWYKILIKNKSVLMEDPINQSYMLRAMYELGYYDDICNILPEKVLCTSPYHYYMGRIHQKKKEISEALIHYKLYIKELRHRTYEKYFQDSGFAIKDAYSYVLQIYNGNNIDSKFFAEIYLSLYQQGFQTFLNRDILVKTHNFIPVIVSQLEGRHPFLAQKCLIMYARNTKTLVLDVYNQKIHNMEAEKARICASLSHKIGFGITWLPRKTRKFLKDIRQHGIKNLWKNAVKKGKEIAKKQHIYQITDTFLHKVLKGYDIYAKVVREYGSNAELLLSAEATGDAYIYGMMFAPYVKKNYPDKVPVYGVFGQSSVVVAGLFKIKDSIMLSKEEFHFLYNLLMFVSKNVVNVDSMHYHVFYRHTGILNYLEGVHGLNYFMQAMAYLNIRNRNEFTRPTFLCDNNNLEKLFKNAACISGRTVIIAPYAKTVKPIPMYFWIQMTERLRQKGFCVCTNSIGESEPPICGTTAVFVPYDQSVPFVERAGAVIGLRSGFMDVISSAKCLKISLCNENNYKRGICHISDSFSLSAMYEEPRQYDLLYKSESAEELIKNIVELVANELEEDNVMRVMSKENNVEVVQNTKNAGGGYKIKKILFVHAFGNYQNNDMLEAV